MTKGAGGTEVRRRHTTGGEKLEARWGRGTSTQSLQLVLAGGMERGGMAATEVGMGVQEGVSGEREMGATQREDGQEWYEETLPLMGEEVGDAWWHGDVFRPGEERDDDRMKIAFLNIRRFKVAQLKESARLQERLWGFMSEYGVEAVGLGDTGLDAPPSGLRASDTTHATGKISARARHIWGKTGMHWAMATGYQSGRDSLTEGGSVMTLGHMSRPGDKTADWKHPGSEFYLWRNCSFQQRRDNGQCGLH